MVNSIIIDKEYITINMSDRIDKFNHTVFSTLLEALKVSNIEISSCQIKKVTNEFLITSSINLPVLDTYLSSIELYLIVEQQTCSNFYFSAKLEKISFSKLLEIEAIPNFYLNRPLFDALKSPFKDVKFIFDSQDQKLYFDSLKSETEEDTNAPLNRGTYIDLFKLNNQNSNSNFKLENLDFQLLHSYTKQLTDCYIYGTLMLDNFPIELVLGLPSSGMLSSSKWQFMLNNELDLVLGLPAIVNFISKVSQHSATELVDLNALLSQADSQEDGLLTKLKKIPHFYLKQFMLLFDPKQTKVSLIEFAIKSNKSLPIIEDKFVLEEIGFGAVIDLARTKPHILLNLYGAMSLGDNLELAVSLQLPIGDKSENWLFEMNGSLYLDNFSNISKLPVNTQLGDYQFPEPFIQLRKIEVDEFYIEFNPLERKLSTASLKILLEGECHIADDLELQAPSFNIKINDPFNHTKERSITGAISAGISIFDTHFVVSAEKTDAAWIFTGGTGTLYQGKFIENMKEHGITLPAYLEEIELKELEFKFTLESSNISPDTEAVAEEDEGKENEEEQDTAQKTKPVAAFDLGFTVAADFPLNTEKTQKLAVELDINLHRTTEKKYLGSFDGRLLFHLDKVNPEAALAFAIHAAHEEKDFLAAIYSDTNKKSVVSIKSLIEKINPAVSLPGDFNIELHYAVLALQRDKKKNTTVLFATEIGTGINLSKLPLVGRMFEREQTLSCIFQLLATSGEFQAPEINKINSLTPATVSKLPGDEIAANTFKANAQLRIGELSFDLKDIIAVNPQAKEGKLTTSTVQPKLRASAATDNSQTQLLPGKDNQAIKWFKVQRSFGPVQIAQVGVTYRDEALDILLDASLSFAGLTLSLDDFGAKFKLAKLSQADFSPEFHLAGIGVNYQNSAVAIGGALLRKPLSAAEAADAHLKPDEAFEYMGLLRIRTQQLELCAMGSYQDYQGHPSLFAYATLNYPLGGPPFFFVTGLAAGFGYNRRLILPDIKQVPDFPLLQLANTKQSSNLTEQLTKLKAIIPPATDQSFLALGVRFTSFKIIESFILLNFKFGKEFVIDLIGISQLTVPAKSNAKNALAEAKLALKGTFNPAQGFLGLQAELLPGSYVFSKDCRLNGGFAFYSWFAGKRKDDFVLSLGGYHPRFKAEEHGYPNVPRLELNWQLSKEITGDKASMAIKGDAYFALTPAMLMVGGHLNLLWQSESLAVDIKVGADFLVNWQPYHYEGEAYANIHASYTFNDFGIHKTFSVDLGANISFWGPEFAGKAHIDLGIISFDVTFGNNKTVPEKLKWDEFETRCLPGDRADMCKINVQQGLVNTLKIPTNNEELHIVNPKQLKLTLTTAIPIKTAAYASNKAIELNTKGQNEVGIAPMLVKAENFTSHSLITIEHQGKNVSDQFIHETISQNVPSSLWKPKDSLTLDQSSLQNKDLLINDVAMGLTISPKEQIDNSSKASSIFNMKQLLTPIQPCAEKANFNWQSDLLVFNATEQAAAERITSIEHDIISQTAMLQRQKLLNEFVFDLDKDPIQLNTGFAQTWIDAPQVGANQ